VGRSAAVRPRRNPRHQRRDRGRPRRSAGSQEPPVTSHAQTPNRGLPDRPGDGSTSVSTVARPRRGAHPRRRARGCSSRRASIRCHPRCHCGRREHARSAAACATSAKAARWTSTDPYGLLTAATDRRRDRAPAGCVWPQQGRHGLLGARRD